MAVWPRGSLDPFKLPAAKIPKLPPLDKIAGVVTLRWKHLLPSLFLNVSLKCSTSFSFWRCDSFATSLSMFPTFEGTVVGRGCSACVTRSNRALSLFCTCWWELDRMTTSCCLTHPAEIWRFSQCLSLTDVSRPYVEQNASWSSRIDKLSSDMVFSSFETILSTGHVEATLLSVRVKGFCETTALALWEAAARPELRWEPQREVTLGEMTTAFLGGFREDRGLGMGSPLVELSGGPIKESSPAS